MHGTVLIFVRLQFRPTPFLRSGIRPGNADSNEGIQHHPTLINAKLLASFENFVEKVKSGLLGFVGKCSFCPPLCLRITDVVLTKGEGEVWPISPFFTTSMIWELTKGVHLQNLQKTCIYRTYKRRAFTELQKACIYRTWSLSGRYVCSIY